VGSGKIRQTTFIDPPGYLALYWRCYGPNGPKSHLSLQAHGYTSEKLAWFCPSDLVKNPLAGGSSIIFRPFAAPETVSQTPENVAGSCVEKSGQ
jgi:hypothetical protein